MTLSEVCNAVALNYLLSEDDLPRTRCLAAGVERAVRYGATSLGAAMCGISFNTLAELACNVLDHPECPPPFRLLQR